MNSRIKQSRFDDNVRQFGSPEKMMLLAAMLISTQVLAQSGTWTTKAPMPTARGHVAAGVVNGIVYVVGGQQSTGPALTTNEAYDPLLNTWTSRAPMPTARALQGTNGAVANSLLYVIGGNAGGFCSNANEAYNSLTDSWAVLAPMPTPRCHLAVMALNGLVYAIGGTDTSGAIGYTTVEVYNPTTNSWFTAAPMPTGRSQLAAEAVGNKIYAIGGVARPCCPLLNTNEAYDPLTNTWSPLAPMPTARADFGTAAVGGVIYAVGGGSLATNEAYDPTTNTWTTPAPMPAARCCLGAAAVGSVIYAIGGFGNSGAALDATEAFTPATDGLPDCTLRVIPSYSSGTLSLAFTLGTSYPQRWNVWFVNQSAATRLWSIPLPAIEPAVSFTVPIALPAPANFGIFTTLSASPEGILCLDWKTVNTGGAAVSIQQLWSVVERSGILSNPGGQQ